MKKYIFLLFIIVLAVGLLAWRYSSASKVSSGVIRVGAIISLSGDAAVIGEPARNIMQMAVDEINASGGIEGRKIEFIVEDGKCIGQDAANATRKLIDVDKVQVIIGGFCSTESLVAAPIAEKAKVALLSPGSTSPKLTSISKYFARDYPSDASQGTVLANFAYNVKGWRNVAFIQEQLDYPQGVYDSFSRAFTALGGKVSNEQFPTEQTDFRSTVTKVQSLKPDAVFVDTQTPAVAGRVLKQMSQLGFSPPLFLIDITITDPTVVAENKTILEGAMGAVFGVNSGSQKFQDLLSHYKLRYGADMPYQSYGQVEYDAMYLIRDAIIAQGYDGTKIAEWLHTIKDWQGTSGSVTIGSDGDRVGGAELQVVRNGKVEPYQK